MNSSAVCSACDLEAAVVQLGVVEAAQQHEGFQCGCAAVSPVLDVVRFEVAGAVAAGERAACRAAAQRTA